MNYMYMHCMYIVLLSLGLEDMPCKSCKEIHVGTQRLAHTTAGLSTSIGTNVDAVYISELFIFTLCRM